MEGTELLGVNHTRDNSMINHESNLKLFHNWSPSLMVKVTGLMQCLVCGQCCRIGQTRCLIVSLLYNLQIWLIPTRLLPAKYCGLLRT